MTKTATIKRLLKSEGLTLFWQIGKYRFKNAEGVT
jgi:hypothetical protein